MSNDDNNTTSRPIPIVGRNRSSSLASSIPALSTSPTSPLPGSIQTPSSTFSLRFAGQNQPHHRSPSEGSSGGPGGSPSSPLAYFLGAATSPIRTTNGGSFPFHGKGVSTSAIDEDEESPPGGSTIGLFGMGAHARRGSWAQNGAFGNAAPTVGASGNNLPSDRGAGVLRRLSLSGAFQRPTFNPSSVPPPPPPSAVSPSAPAIPTLAQPRPGRKGRANTLAVNDPTKKRGISPMGERLLKGSFDGFI